MSNKFQVLADNKVHQGTATVMTDTEYETDSERQDGSIPNTVIKSKLNNTALRQSTLFSTAFVGAFEALDNRENASSIEYSPNDTLSHMTLLIKNVLEIICRKYASEATDNLSDDLTDGSIQVHDSLYSANARKAWLNKDESSNKRYLLSTKNSTLTDRYDDIAFFPNMYIDSNGFHVDDNTYLNGILYISDDGFISSTSTRMTLKNNDIRFIVQRNGATTNVTVNDLLDRLDNLGFKSGVCSNFSGSSTIAIGEPSINSLTKQGQMVILNLAIVPYGTTDNTNPATISFTVPNDFKPTNTVYGDYWWIYMVEVPLVGTMRFNVRGDIIIRPDGTGTIVIKNKDSVSPTAGAITIIGAFGTLNFGYRLN